MDPPMIDPTSSDGPGRAFSSADERSSGSDDSGVASVYLIRDWYTSTWECCSRCEKYGGLSKERRSVRNSAHMKGASKGLLPALLLEGSNTTTYCESPDRPMTKARGLSVSVEPACAS